MAQPNMMDPNKAFRLKKAHEYRVGVARPVIMIRCECGHKTLILQDRWDDILEIITCSTCGSTEDWLKQ